MAILDDICATMHAQGDGADEKFLQKLNMGINNHKHLQQGPGAFTIVHYAGNVTYQTQGIYIHTHTHTHTHIHTYIHTSVHTYIHTYKHA